MKKFNPAHAKATMELLAKSPFYDLIDMNMVAIEEGYARVDLEITKRHHNPFGSIHGGVFASLFDVTTEHSTQTRRSTVATSRLTCW